MSETKHTPVPWRVIEDHGQYRVNGMLDNVCMVNRINPAQEANAQLIAAAPDLLEALEDLEAFTEKYLERNCHLGEDPDESAAVKNARQAIAKAKGEKYRNTAHEEMIEEYLAELAGTIGGSND